MDRGRVPARVGGRAAMVRMRRPSRSNPGRGPRRADRGADANLDRPAARPISRAITISRTHPRGAEELAESRHTGQVILAHDGSPAAEHALGAAARLLAERRALALVVWKAGLGFELLEIASVVGLPSAPIDIRTALDIEQAMDEQAWRLAENGARIAREAGFDAEPLVVAEDADVPISETILTTAKERGSPAVVLGQRAPGRLQEVFLSDTRRDPPRPVPRRGHPPRERLTPPATPAANERRRSASPRRPRTPSARRLDDPLHGLAAVQRSGCASRVVA